MSEFTVNPHAIEEDLAREENLLKAEIDANPENEELLWDLVAFKIYGLSWRDKIEGGKDVYEGATD